MAATPASTSSSVSDSDRPIGSWPPGLTSGGARPPHQVCEAKSIQSCEGSLEPQLPVSYICHMRYDIWSLRNKCNQRCARVLAGRLIAIPAREDAGPPLRRHWLDLIFKDHMSY